MSQRMAVVVPPLGRPTRADRVVADTTGLSRAYVQRLISEGRLTAAGRPLRANTAVSAGDLLELELPPPRTESLAPEDVALTVIYEDDDLLIVDKPAGMLTHPAPGHATGTLVNALLGRGGPLGTIAGVERPGIVHRLDRDTSGLLMVARNDLAQQSLMAQLKARRIGKTYLALVAGTPPAEVGRIEAPIGRDPRNYRRMAVVPGGRAAITGYRVRERFPGWSLLEVDLHTGRTHQIRVHLASIGQPVAGDRVYATGDARHGPAGLGRLFLHSWRLELAAVASGELIRAEAPLPAELERVLQAMRESRP